MKGGWMLNSKASYGFHSFSQVVGQLSLTKAPLQPIQLKVQQVQWTNKKIALSFSASKTV